MASVSHEAGMASVSHQVLYLPSKGFPRWESGRSCCWLPLLGWSRWLCDNWAVTPAIIASREPWSRCSWLEIGGGGIGLLGDEPSSSLSTWWLSCPLVLLPLIPSSLPLILDSYAFALLQLAKLQISNCSVVLGVNQLITLHLVCSFIPGQSSCLDYIIPDSCISCL